MRCERCGYDAGDGDVFCPECGRRLPAEVPVEETTELVETPAEAPGAVESEEREPSETTTEETESTEKLEPGVPGVRAGGEPKYSGWAIASLVLGIGAFTVVPLIGAILAVIFGIIAKRDIKRDAGDRTGSGLATAGITLGIVGFLVPLVAGGLVFAWGFVFWRSGTEARDDLMTGVQAAELYYHQNAGSFKGLTPGKLSELSDRSDGSPVFRRAPGRETGTVYVGKVTDQSVQLYAVSERGARYQAVANGDVSLLSGNMWEYNFDTGYRPWIDRLHERVNDILDFEG